MAKINLKRGLTDIVLYLIIFSSTDYRDVCWRRNLGGH